MVKVRTQSRMHLVPPTGLWAKRGACRSVPPAAFFPEKAAEAEAAKQVCRHCPVLEDCRAYALAHPVLAGVWGAMSEDDRREARTHDERPPARWHPWAESGRSPGPPPSLARVARYVSPASAGATASLLRAGRLGRPAGRWDFEGHLNDVGGSDLFALFLGDNEDADGGKK